MIPPPPPRGWTAPVPAPTGMLTGRQVDADPDAPAELADLADLVAYHLGALEHHGDQLARALDAVESLLADVEYKPSVDDLLIDAFFDSLAPADRERLRPWLTRPARALLESLDMPDPGAGPLRGDAPDRPRPVR